MPRRTLLLACVLASVLARPAGADVAPGRIAFGVGLPQPAANVDAGGASAAVALPDGGAVLIAPELGRGIVAAQIKSDGALDPAFGDGGVAHVPVEAGAAPSGLPPSFVPLQMIRQPDGRLLVAGYGPPRSRYELGQFVLVRMTASGALDPTFGRGGVALPGFQSSCGGLCQPASLQPDGAIVVTGNTGQAVPGSELSPGGPEPRFQWIVARLTSNGTLDPSFGRGGIVEIPGAVGRNGGGSGTAVLGDGRIVALGRGPMAPLLTRLTPAGAPDPEFHGGSPAAPPMAYAFNMLVHPDGTVDVQGDQRLVRFRSDGEPDPSFGTGGVLALPRPSIREGLLPSGDRGVLFYAARSFDPRPPESGDLVVHRITADGRFDAGTGGAAGRTVQLGFGGGLASMFAQGRPRPLPPLEQASFGLGQLVGRPDGSLLAAGGVRVVRYRGEGTGSSTGLFAAAALTRGLAPLADFGGRPSAPLLGVRIADQTPAVSSRLKRVVVRVSASSPGLSLVRVRARGRVIAQSLEPVYEAATSTAKVRLTRTGERLLRRRRAIAITVTATLRDVLTQRTTATTRGVLRPDARRVRRAPRDAVEAAVRRAARHYAVRDRIAVGATLRSRRNDAWSLVTGSYGKRGLWAAWVRRRSGGAYRVEVFRTRRFDPGRRPPCDIRPAFSEPDC